MEELLCVPQLCSGSPRSIGPPVSIPLALFTRPVAHWWGLRCKASLCPRENSVIEDAQYLFDVDYQDSTAFRPDVESHVGQILERWDCALSNPAPSTVPWDPVFDDSVTNSRAHAERGLLLQLDLALENNESVAALFTNLSHSWPVAETLRFLALALTFHLAAFSLFVATPTSTLRGFGGISDKPISVRLKETLEINTPDDLPPGSVDSLASVASLARRNPKPEETRIGKKTEKVLPIEVEPKEMTKETITESGSVDAKPPIEPLRVHSREPPEQSLDGHLNDSKSRQDSIASVPSVASPERQGPSKSGGEAQTYKDLILSAIHEAAYYPKAALRNMAHGQAVVSFTIKKDGSLANIAIVSHAHSKILDEAALRIVEKASSHFPPLPDALMRDHVCYVVPIIFKKGL
jgi:TonB family protein